VPDRRARGACSRTAVTLAPVRTDGTALRPVSSGLALSGHEREQEHGWDDEVDDDRQGSRGSAPLDCVAVARASLRSAPPRLTPIHCIHGRHPVYQARQCSAPAETRLQCTTPPQRYLSRPLRPWKPSKRERRPSRIVDSNRTSRRADDAGNTPWLSHSLTPQTPRPPATPTHSPPCPVKPLAGAQLRLDTS
jgi:hypothetical protein